MDILVKRQDYMQGLMVIFGFGELNDERHIIIDISLAVDLKIVNTCFKKQEEHLITYKSKIYRS